MATAAAASQFTGVDFLDFDSLLSEEERAVRDTVRTWVDENLHSRHRRGVHRGPVPQAADSRHGRAGAVRRQPARGIRLRGAQQRGLRPHHAGAGAGRLGHPLVRLGAGRAGDVPDLRLRLRRAEAALAAPARLGPGDRLLRPDRAGLRLESRRHDHHRARRPRTAGCSTAPRCGSPTAPRPRSRSSGPRPAGSTTPSPSAASSSPPTPRATPPRIRRGSSRSARATRARSISQDVHLPKDAILPKSGGLKSPLMCLTQARYGIAWGAIGAAMACYDEALRYAGQPGDVRQADRRHPDPAGPAGRHADRDHQGPVHDPAARPAQGRGHDDARAGVALQAQQREHGLRHAPARRGGCSAPTASWSSTTRCGTWRTSSRSTPTRARTTCTRSSSGRRSRGSAAYYVILVTVYCSAATMTHRPPRGADQSGGVVAYGRDMAVSMAVRGLRPAVPGRSGRRFADNQFFSSTPP